ncbi:MAG: exopolyphosphatase [Acidimicrobiales bacterium]
MLIADRTDREIERVTQITRLGEGVDESRRLAPEAMERTLRVLAEFRRRMEARQAVRGRLVATSAVRDAANRDEFLDRATAAVGIRAELLTGDEEGRTAFAGATRDLPRVGVDTVVLDIGGGSTELVIGRGAELRAASLDLGCVRLTERYLRHDPPTEDEIATAVHFIDGSLEAASTDGLALGDVSDGCRLVGLAGTVATLAMLEQGMADYDRSRVHRFVLSTTKVGRWVDVLAREPARARAGRPGMVAGRQDVIVGGLLVLRQVMHRLGTRTCLVSESDILDGLVASVRGSSATHPEHDGSLRGSAG